MAFRQQPKPHTYCSALDLTGIGFQLLIYMAALQDIDKSLYESADIDGASEFRSSSRLLSPSFRPPLST